MRIEKKSVLGLVIIVVILSLILLLNLKSVGREPRLISLSKSVAYPGDTIILKGEHFGGEISKGRIYINDQMLFDNFINHWSEDEISILLPDDFKSGMVSVSNMFGSSKAHLITSITDVPRIKMSTEVPGYPFIDSVNIISNSENIVNISGRNFGTIIDNTSLILSYKDSVSSEEFLVVEHNRIISWKNDEIVFYLPYGLSNLTVYVKNTKGYSNNVFLDDKTPSVSYIYKNPVEYNLKQRVDIKNVVALKGSYINLFIPCIIQGINQKDVVLISTEGYYSKDSNTFNVVAQVSETGDEFNYILESKLTNYSLETEVNKTSLGRKYDKKSPDYIEGFFKTPGVVENDEKLNGAAKWVIRNSNNYYDKSILIFNWISKYIKLDDNGSNSSVTSYNKRIGSEDGIVNLTIAMLRAIGIPSRKVKGIIVKDEVMNYQWLEYFLPNGGWVTYDIIEKFVNSNYVNGYLEGNRIAFSKGVTNIEYQEDNFNYKIYALQNTTDNSEGNVESYDAVWHNVEAE